MVSDFVEEHGHLTNAQFFQAKQHYPGIVQSACQLLEYGAERERY